MNNKLLSIVKNSFSFSDVCRSLGLTVSSRNIKKLKKQVTLSNIDISHFKHPFKGKCIWEKISKTCPVCCAIFVTQKDHPREKTVCSRACSNTYFRSGSNNPNFIDGNRNSGYRKIAFDYYPNICNRCLFDKNPNILIVHHKDRNRLNNVLDNLEILCPNCHSEEHFNSKDGLYNRRN
jgi:hypothetical protein